MNDEDFLARWSRRKREAKAAVDKAAADAPPAAEPAETPMPAPSVTAETPPAEEVDLSSLPPVESITAATDVTAFLRKGIPPELSRAALRRAWASDPAIRDFVGLAENAWDFSDPHAMPGFGPLDCSEAELGELVDKIVGGVRRAADGLANPLTELGDEGQVAGAEHDPGSESRTANATSDFLSTDEATIEESSATLAALQPAVARTTETARTTESDRILVPRRTHGGALPR